MSFSLCICPCGGGGGWLQVFLQIIKDHDSNKTLRTNTHFRPLSVWVCAPLGSILMELLEREADYLSGEALAPRIYQPG